TAVERGFLRSKMQCPKSVSVTLLPMPDFTIGVDMGGTNLRVAAIGTDGQLLEKITLGVKVALGRDYVIGQMCDAILRLTAQYKSNGRFVGAGIGVPGIIDMETGMMRKSANLPGWSDYPVRDEIERRVGGKGFFGKEGKGWGPGEKWVWAGGRVRQPGDATLGPRPGRGRVPRGE